MKCLCQLLLKEREAERKRAMRGRGQRIRRTSRGTVIPLGGRGVGSSVATGRGSAKGVRRGGGMLEEEDEEKVTEIGVRTRLSSKRGRPEEDMEEEPAAKH